MYIFGKYIVRSAQVKKKLWTLNFVAYNLISGNNRKGTVFVKKVQTFTEYIIFIAVGINIGNYITILGNYNTFYNTLYNRIIFCFSFKNVTYIQRFPNFRLELIKAV